MTAPSLPGFPRNRPEGSPSLRRQKPDARNQTFGLISHASDPKLFFFEVISYSFGIIFRPGISRVRSNYPNHCLEAKNVFLRKICFLASSVLTCSWVFWPKNNTERIWNYLKKQVLSPKCGKLDQKSDFGHVRTHCWLNKWRNIQRKIYENI